MSEWRLDAACHCLPPDWWFPEREPGAKPRDYARGYQVCETCPVKQPCLEYALRAEEKYGMWGGLTPKERVQIRVKEAV